MSTVVLQLTPEIATLGPQRLPQLCYALVTLRGASNEQPRSINWAFVADASRSMRIPIVDEAQFRSLIRDHGAQETLVDGVAVWQLTTPVPPALRAAVKSPLEHVARALHALLERLDNADRFALVACAETAVVLHPSAPGDARAELVRGIEQLGATALGEETELDKGITLALEELQRGRQHDRINRLLLLTDGFTRHPEQCIRLAATAAEQGIAVSTLGIGGEFQEDLLTKLADMTGGQALFVRQPKDIPKVVAHELTTARHAKVGTTRVLVTPLSGATVRRVTRIRPALAVLYENEGADSVATVRPGDVPSEGIVLLVELLVPAMIESRAPLAELSVQAGNTLLAHALLNVRRYAQLPPLPEAVRNAAAYANVARLHQRAAAAAAAGNTNEAVRLFAQIAKRIEELGALDLAQTVRDQAATLEHAGPTAIGIKELTYSTRRLGDTDR